MNCNKSGCLAIPSYDEIIEFKTICGYQEVYYWSELIKKQKGENLILKCE